MYGARGQCIIYMQKEYFKLEPSDIQKFEIGGSWCLFLNFFIGLMIDLRLVKNRKIIVFVTGLLGIWVNLVLITSDSVSYWFIAMFLDGMFGNTRCAIYNAWVVEQSRKDVKLGSDDLQTLNGLFGAAGGAMGSILSTVLINHKNARFYFYVCAGWQFGMCIAALLINQEIDENKFASGKDHSLVLYEQKMRRKYPMRYRNRPVEPPNIF